jgi:hypothetical protein
MMFRVFRSVTVCFYAMALSGQQTGFHVPVDQPDTEGRIIRGGNWIVSKLIDIASKGSNQKIGAGPGINGR